jgi:hypothetical protein
MGPRTHVSRSNSLRQEGITADPSYRFSFLTLRSVNDIRPAIPSMQRCISKETSRAARFLSLKQVLRKIVVMDTLHDQDAAGFGFGARQIC